jgi:hypothetical protein
LTTLFFHVGENNKKLISIIDYICFFQTWAEVVCVSNRINVGWNYELIKYSQLLQCCNVVFTFTLFEFLDHAICKLIKEFSRNSKWFYNSQLVMWSWIITFVNHLKTFVKVQFATQTKKTYHQKMSIHFSLHYFSFSSTKVFCFSF